MTNTDTNTETNTPLNWGFDLTDFGFEDNWGKFVAATELKFVALTNNGFQWRAFNATDFITNNNPETGEYSRPNTRDNEKGYASYIGITGTPNEVKLTVKAVKKYATYIKGESKKKRDFI